MASLLQHSAHLGETLVEVLEVAYAKGGSDGIEGLVFIAQVQTVLLLETDHLVQSHALHLLPSYLHHALGDVSTHELFGMEHLSGENGEVARAGSDVEHLLGSVGEEALDGFLAPALVDVPRETMVEGVVGRGDVVKHLLYQLSLISCALIGLDLFLLIHYFLVASHSLTFFSMRAAMSPSSVALSNFSPVMCSKSSM